MGPELELTEPGYLAAAPRAAGCRTICVQGLPGRDRSRTRNAQRRTQDAGWRWRWRWRGGHPSMEGLHSMAMTCDVVRPRPRQRPRPAAPLQYCSEPPLCTLKPTGPIPTDSISPFDGATRPPRCELMLMHSESSAPAPRGCAMRQCCAARIVLSAGRAGASTFHCLDDAHCRSRCTRRG